MKTYKLTDDEVYTMFICMDLSRHELELNGTKQAPELIKKINKLSVKIMLGYEKNENT